MTGEPEDPVSGPVESVDEPVDFAASAGMPGEAEADEAAVVTGETAVVPDGGVMGGPIEAGSETAPRTSIAAKAMVGEPPRSLTVIVPVYRGVDDVRACLESVLTHAEAGGPAFDLLVINDASPEPDVVDYLVKLAASTLAVETTVFHNDENLGFVRTVNRGLRAVSGDVVVLNADTVVTAGWLDRLADAAHGHENVATVTPLTNFGSICTLPPSIVEAFELAGPGPRIDDCAAFIADRSLGLRPEVITGVGFCMYITREALDLCGLLDEDTFGLGYGEEVDFCLRATRIGLRHLVDDATFVYHRGGGSFGAARTAGMARGSALLHARYPFFRAANRQERTADPLRVTFAALELGLHARREERPHVLHILHSPPDALGGTEKHLRTLIHALLPEFDSAIFYPVESGFVVRTIWDTGSGEPVEQEFAVPGAARRVSQVHDEVAAEALSAAIAMFGFDAVHIQNLVNHSLAPLDVLADFPGPVICSVRDLYLACPNHWLLYRNEQACGIPSDLSVCERCLPETRDLSRAYLERFRATVAERIGTVDRWVFASQSAADTLSRAYDLDPARIELIEHGAIIDLDRSRIEPDEGLIFDEPLRLALVGLGWPKKGLDVVNRLADDLGAVSSSIEIHHFGELKAAPSRYLHTHGHYDNELLPDLLQWAGIQVVLLPAPYAETFGHVMTEALIAGLPLIGTRYGALGERIRAHQVGWTVDPEDPAGLRELVENLDRGRAEILRATEAVQRVALRSVADTADRYAALYRSSTPSTPSTPSASRSGEP
jgi:GT2 family glycosyltransferase/glycosyltransferase involved in cell wall biosynthesis